ncbi:MAG: glycosyltransferase [Bacteroides sp.]|nr:glycosyltransferase [Prevotella sp.]MCM1408279.1 glycosyltransferase [Treponema brennaborense]MCM1470489.1 glycosyltransferase [Bacteroides sp.]
MEKYLRRCIDSILAQTFTDFECILVDDGSPDGCPAICDEYAKKDARVRVIHQENKGLSAARNAGLDAARGEWIGFVDSDDWIEAETYEVAYKAAIENSADLVQWNIVMERAGKKIHTTKQKEGIFSVLKDVTYFEPSVCHKLVSRKLIYDNNIRFPRTRLSEDKAVSFRCYLLAGICYQIEKIFYHYDYRGNSISRTISKEMVLDERDTVQSMEAWAQQKNFKNYEKIIYEQKCICKQHSILYMKKPDFDLCRSLFPEINKIVLHDKTKFSVLFFFTYFHFDFAALLLIKIWKILRNV